MGYYGSPECLDDPYLSPLALTTHGPGVTNRWSQHIAWALVPIAGCFAFAILSTSRESVMVLHPLKVQGLQIGEPIQMPPMQVGQMRAAGRSQNFAKVGRRVFQGESSHRTADGWRRFISLGSVAFQGLGAVLLATGAFFLFHRRKQPEELAMMSYTANERSFDDGSGIASIANKADEPSASDHAPLHAHSNPQPADPSDGRPREGGDRLQRLKELAWTKEVKDDITYAEFAMAVNPAAPAPSNSLSSEKSVTGIDYFKIADKLDENLERMQRKGRWTLNPNDIELLMERLRSTKESIDQFMVKAQKAGQELEEEVEEAQRAQKAPKPKEETAEEKKGLPLRLELFVREDGTVDWDGAIESGRELAVFGKEVWERLNGRESEVAAGTAPRGSPASFTDIDEHPSIVALKIKLEALEASLAEVHQQRELKQAALWEMRSKGGVVTPEMRLEMRAAAQNVLDIRRRLLVQRLDLDMERICLYLEQEIEQSTSLQEQKMLVAEFGLLDKQLQALLSILADWESPDIIDDIDESELEVLEKEISDLKVRLGFDMQGGTAIDWGKSIRDLYAQTTVKAQEGVAFYIKGTKLLFSDVLYALWLFKRTIEGYTLKPREVRTIRRTVKDVLTFIPALIILIIPLSPVGHVLVFSFIQRFFPDFFPTAFSDRRQNLLKMYEEIERKPPEESPTAARQS